MFVFKDHYTLNKNRKPWGKKIINNPTAQDKLGTSIRSIGLDKNIKKLRLSNLATTWLTLLLVLRWKNIAHSPLNRTSPFLYCMLPSAAATSFTVPKIALSYAKLRCGFHARLIQVLFPPPK